MIDKEPHEEAAIAAVLPLLGEYVAEVGMHKPLADYTRAEVLILVEVVVDAYRMALISQIPPSTDTGIPF